jgi:hypothetical protein
LKVDSLHRPISNRKRKVLFYVVTAVYILGFVFAKWTSPDVSGMMLTWGFMLTILYATSIFLIFLFGRIRGRPLIITDRGITYYPLVAERWADIESYSWETFKGLSRIPGPTLFSLSEGVTLRLMNKGIIPRNINIHSGHSTLAMFLVFFTSEQIEITDSILEQHGIRKKKGGKS